MPFLGVAGIGGLIAFLKAGSLPSAVTGGTLSEDSTYFYRTFTGSSTLTVTGGILKADILAVAGGGSTSTGSPRSGGGGAGGVLYQSAASFIPTNYAVTVGAGAASVTGNLNGLQGNASTISSFTAVGGGYGGGYEVTSGVPTGGNGGSGGGGGVQYLGPVYQGGTATAGQGNNGGAGLAEPVGGWVAGGGGGGAGGVGTAASGNSTASNTQTPGNGGPGTNTYSSWHTATGTGVSGYIGGGGAGGGINSGGSNIYGTAGSGGGGSFSAGTVNTGGGAGSGGFAGGSGLVIVRYLKTAVKPSTSAYELIGTINLTSTQTSLNFTNFPASQYRHLQLRMAVRTVEAAAASSFVMQFNGDTGNNYSWHHLRGNGSSVLTGQSSATSVMYPGAINGNSATAGAFSFKVIDILDFSSPSKNTTIRAVGGEVASSEVGLYSSAWYNTAPVTAIKMYASADFAIGTRVSLYGVRG